MSENVISVEGISKRYRVGVQTKADTLAEQIKNTLAYPVRNFRNIARLTSFANSDDPSVFWALRDINFQVKQGEVLGIVGHNGAGKSTLLKIISRITEPSSGLIKLRGRVSALLEVGTGFHPELSGRDNVYMNGTILGMRKYEIDQKFDEIVAFSGIERHLDTPVKFYSSGMRVRLAFSVAAHLEPEILIIDEVLAVGDAEFQRKCLGKMENVASEGRTVLFVSHNMPAVRSLCSRSLLLRKGNLVMDGTPDAVVKEYLDPADGADLKSQIAIKSDEFQILDFKISAVGKELGDEIEQTDDIQIKIRIERFTNDRVDAGLQFKDESGKILFVIGSGVSEDYPDAKTIEMSSVIPKHFFNSGQFTVNLLVNRNRAKNIVKVDNYYSFSVMDRKVELGRWMGRTKGPLAPKFDWAINGEDL